MSPIVLVKLLLVAVLIEFVTIRTLSRIGSIPSVPWIQTGYQTMLTVGSVALNLAAGLAILLGFLFVYRISRDRMGSGLLKFSLLAMTLAVAATLLEEPSPIFSVAFSIFVILVVVSLIAHFSTTEDSILIRLTQLLTIVGIVSIFYFKLIPQLEYLLGVPLSFTRPLEVYLLGEVATIGATVVICAGYLRHSKRSPISKKSLAYASLITGVFAVFYVTSSWLLSIIAMWTLGFTMFLPFPIYVIVLFVFIYTVTLSWSRSQSWMAMGLLLLFFAGRLAQLGYLSMLMVIGLALISFPEAFGFRKDRTIVNE